jgi:hypothetical protein
MKKKSKIRLIKNNQNDNSYTFVMDENLSSTQNSDSLLNNIKSRENTEINEVGSPDKIYKKKKVLTNKDIAKSSKGLKFINPSQRNHSSVYE